MLCVALYMCMIAMVHSLHDACPSTAESPFSSSGSDLRTLVRLRSQLPGFSADGRYQPKMVDEDGGMGDFAAAGERGAEESVSHTNNGVGERKKLIADFGEDDGPKERKVASVLRVSSSDSWPLLTGVRFAASI
jgi:hypothetical protein